MHIDIFPLQWLIPSGGSKGGGALLVRPHLATKYFSISCSYWGKFNKFVSWRPDLRVSDPLWENPESASDSYCVLWQHLG